MLTIHFFNFQTSQIAAFNNLGFKNIDNYFQFVKNTGGTQETWFNRGHMSPAGDFGQKAQKVRDRP